MEKDYCEYFLEHTQKGLGDNHVFSYFYGQKLLCDNYGCKYKNNSGDRFSIECQDPAGVCLSEGLKGRLEEIHD